MRWIDILSLRSMSFTAEKSSWVTKVQAFPLRSARPVRPMRWV